MHHLHLHAVRAHQCESRSPDRPLRVLRELPSCRGPKMEQLEAHDQEARGHRRASHEADRVPTAVAGRLGRVPGQVQVTHRSSVCTLYAQRGFSRVQFNAYRSAAAASNKSARSAPAIARLSDVPRVTQPVEPHKANNPARVSLLRTLATVAQAELRPKNVQQARIRLRRRRWEKRRSRPTGRIRRSVPHAARTSGSCRSRSSGARRRRSCPSVP